MITLPVRAPLSGPRSEWRRDVATAPRHAQSAHVVAHLLEQVKLATPNVNIDRYNLALYEVDEQVPVLDVAWKGGPLEMAGYAGLLGTPASAAGPFRNVPIPAGAVRAAGTDGALAVHRPATGELWELWQPVNGATGEWSAQWGGYLADVAGSTGAYERGLGVSASGLVMAPGILTIEEARAGHVGHALGLGIPAVVGKLWSHPAVRCDGTGTSTAPYAIHEGQRFVLPATVDIDAITRPGSWSGARRLPLTPIAKMIARAAQMYGFIVVDRAGCVAISTESGLPAKAATGLNPWTSIRAGVPEYRLLDGFPWELLEALPFDYGKGIPL